MVNLVEEIEDEFYSYLDKTFDIKTNGKPTEEDMLAFACHFAEWGKQQALKNAIKGRVVGVNPFDKDAMIAIKGVDCNLNDKFDIIWPAGKKR